MKPVGCDVYGENIRPGMRSPRAGAYRLVHRQVEPSLESRSHRTALHQRPRRYAKWQVQRLPEEGVAGITGRLTDGQELLTH